MSSNYYQQAINNQAGSNYFLNNQKNNAITQAQNVLKQKYGNNIQFDANKGFYDYGNSVSGYNTSLDPQLALQYNQALSNYQNYQNAIAQANQLQYQKQASDRQAALMQQQGQKYTASQLQAMGLGNTGLSESTQAGLMNTYSNILAENNRTYGQSMNQLYSDLASNNAQSNMYYGEQIAEAQDETTNAVYDRFSTELEYAYDLDSLEAVKERYKDNWTDDMQTAYINAQNYLTNNEKENDKDEIYNRFATELASVSDKASLDALKDKYKALGYWDDNFDTAYSSALNTLNNTQNLNTLNNFKNEINSAYSKEILDSIVERYGGSEKLTEEMKTAYNIALNRINNSSYQSLKEMITGAVDKDTLDILYNLYGDSINNNRTIKTLYDAKVKKIEEDREAAILIQQQQRLTDKYGIDDFDDYIDAATVTSSLIGVKDDENQQELNQLFRKHYTEIPDLTVFDLNWGNNRDKFVILDGKLYRVKKSTPAHYTAKGLKEFLEEKESKK